ncbi:MAG: hypothetical protein KatS3mg111_1552 [Pirellulaceae bacterium]|nr:MAG: hypothetical protein KatS3mg111_1552 [Pirellulaceae bacterium]
MLIRKIRPTDDPMVAGMMSRVLAEFAPHGSVDRSTDIASMSQAHLELTSVCYVVEEADRLIGCGSLQPLADWGPDHCQLRYVCVLPEFRGKGIEQVILRTLIADATRFGYTNAVFHPIDLSLAARQFYQRLGFRLTEATESLDSVDSHDRPQYVLRLTPFPDIHLDAEDAGYA